MSNGFAFGAAALALAIGGFSCTPEVGPGTYFCGPERLCPADLVCDEPTTRCLTEAAAQSFECPTGSAIEPNDSLEDAIDLGTLVCAGDTGLLNSPGCIATASDVDLYKFVFDPTCTSNTPTAVATARYPVGLAAVELELLDEGGAVVSAASLCSEPGDFTGTEELCLDAPLSAGTYYLRLATPPDAPNCDGDCHYNRFSLTFAIARQPLPLNP